MHGLWRVRGKILTRGRIVLACGMALLLFLAILSVYYYNVLVHYEQDVLKEISKVDSLLQRRRNISINLARTVRDYAIHEKGVLSHVTKVRAGSQAVNKSEEREKTAGIESRAESVLGDILALFEGPAAGNLPADKNLAGLIAVAERYPDLKLSENFRRFMEALVDTEKDLSDARMRYSDVVNKFSTQLKTFPSKMFASVYGFEALPYYEADGDAKTFRAVEY